MPKISEFYGIKIYINYSDHPEAHINVSYSGEKAKISIRSGAILGGSLPRTAINLVNRWRKKYQEELLEDWNLAMEHKNLKKIDPLK